MPGLCNLPDEVILLSLNNSLLRRADLAAVAVSCRRLNSVAEDALYARNRDHEASSAVRWAAQHGNIATLNKALKHGLALDETDLSCSPRSSPFQIAVVHGQDSAVAWFLDHGVDVTRVVRPRCHCLLGKTCILHTAICLGNASTAQLLISRGAPLEYPEYYHGGEFIQTANALLEASFSGLDTVVETLIKDYGMNMQGPRGPLCHDALRCAATDNKNVSTVRTLVGLGADVDGLHSQWSSTPLHIAILNGNFAIAHTLLDLGAKVDSYEYDTGPDSSSSEGGEDEEKVGPGTIRVEIAALHDTIASIANRRAPRENHSSPNERSWAESFRAERDNFMGRLIELGADVNAELAGHWDNDLWDRSSPLDLATLIGDTQDMAMLIAAGAEVKSRMLFLAWKDFDRDTRDNTAKIELLLKRGARLDQPIKYGASVLELAAGLADPDKLEEISGLHEILLLSSPKNLATDHLDEVLAQCLINHYWDASTILVRHGARVSCKDKLFSIASRIAEKLRCETRVHGLQDYEGGSRGDHDYGPIDCFSFIIDMGLSSEDQCLIFQDFLRKRLVSLTHLFLDRGLAGRPEATVFLPAYLMLAANWGNICVIKRLWQHAHEASDAILRYLLVQESIIAGNREAVSFFTEQGATPFQHLTPVHISRELKIHEDALLVYNAALDRSEGESSPSLDVLRECRRTQLLAERLVFTRYAGIYLKPFLSPLQVAVKHGHIDIISNLLEHITESEADAITTCGRRIYIPCVLVQANEIREMIEKKGIDCG